MYAQLGSIIFENLNSFSNYSKAGSATYAQHQLLDGKPVLQRTGTALDVISITLKFHASFCSPAKQLALLLDAKEQGEIMPLLWGNGELEGSFVITEINNTIEDTDPSGNIFSCNVGVTLTEYITTNKLKEEKVENKKKAAAVGNKKPTAQKKTNPSTCPQEITKLVNSIENIAAEINTIFTEKGGITTPLNKSRIKVHLSSARNLCDTLISKCEVQGSCAVAHPIIKEKAAEANNKNGLFIISLQSGLGVANSNTNFQTSVKLLKEATRPLINQAITRK